MNHRKIIESARLGRGMSQAELAEKSGTTQAQLSRFLTGKTGVTTETLDRIYLALGMVREERIVSRTVQLNTASTGEAA